MFILLLHEALYMFVHHLVLVLPWSYIISYFSLALIIYHKVQTWLVENPLEAREFCPVFGKDLISSLHLISFIFSIFGWDLISSLHVISSIFNVFGWDLISSIFIACDIFHLQYFCPGYDSCTAYNSTCHNSNILEYHLQYCKYIAIYNIFCLSTYFWSPSCQLFWICSIRFLEMVDISPPERLIYWIKIHQVSWIDPSKHQNSFK